MENVPTVLREACWLINQKPGCEFKLKICCAFFFLLAAKEVSFYLHMLYCCLWGLCILVSSYLVLTRSLGLYWFHTSDFLDQVSYWTEALKEDAADTESYRCWQQYWKRRRWRQFWFRGWRVEEKDWGYQKLPIWIGGLASSYPWYFFKS